MQADKPSNERQPNTQSALGVLACRAVLCEKGKYVRQHLSGDTHPVITHRQHDLPTPLCRPHPDMPARLGVLGRIDQQVGKHLRELLLPLLLLSKPGAGNPNTHAAE